MGALSTHFVGAARLKKLDTCGKPVLILTGTDDKLVSFSNN